MAAHWQENYDLGHILRRDWSKGLGRKLEGKIHIYVGDMDNYYLNNAVYLVGGLPEDDDRPALRRRGGLRRPRRALLERRPHARRTRYSRLRYIQMFAPKIVERIEKTAPPRRRPRRAGATEPRVGASRDLLEHAEAVVRVAEARRQAAPRRRRRPAHVVPPGAASARAALALRRGRAGRATATEA